jgi:hypothetical protein
MSALDPFDGGERAAYKRMSEVTPRRIEWLWADRVAIGKPTIVAGDPGLGKSMITNAYMAAVVSQGGRWTDGASCQRGSVIIVSGEDDPEDTLYPRLQAAGADLNKVCFFQGIGRGESPAEAAAGKTRAFTLADVQVLRDMIREIGDVRLVVIDPIGAFVGNSDSHNNAEVRGLMAPIATLAAETRAAFVLVAHLNKGGGKGTGTSAIYRIAGSLGFAAAARTVWGVIKDPDDPKRRLFLSIKNNVSVDSENGLAYRVKDAGPGGVFQSRPMVEWEAGAVQLSADDAMESPRGGPRGPRPVARNTARQWLEGFLKAGRQRSDAVRAAAKAAGHTGITLQRAKQDLGVLTDTAKPYWWRLPEPFPPSEVPTE